MRELHHIMVWSVSTISAYPKAAPLKMSFDPKLAAKFAAQDAAHAKALAEKDELAAAKDAEIARLRAQIEAAQAANQ